MIAPDVRPPLALRPKMIAPDFRLAPSLASEGVLSGALAARPLFQPSLRSGACSAPSRTRL